MAGGWRKGAGRPKASHTLAAEAAKKLIVERVIAELNPILDAQISIAKGKSKGATFATKELFERAFGKVTDKLQIQEVKKLLKFNE